MWQQLGILYHQLKGCIQSKCQTTQMLRAYQDYKMAGILEHASSHIRYYQEYQQATLHEYPVIDKSFVKDHFASLNQLELSSSQVQEWMNSHKSSHECHQSLGTSGEPGIYLYSIREKIISLGNLLSKMFPQLSCNNKRIAIFHLSKTPYFPIKVSSWKIKWLLLDLNATLEEHLHKLISFNPEVIIASVQTLTELAKLQISGKIALNCQKIIATAEVLTPLAEQFIASGFKQKVHQLYQSAEGCLGVTCEQGTLHLNEEEYFIEKEWIDHQRQCFVPVITTLKRKLQPLIRYRMEDILVLKNERCACGRVALGVERVIGRCEDVLYFKDRLYSGLKPIYADMLNQIFVQNTHIHQYQVIQHSMNHIVFKYHAANDRVQEWINYQLEKLWYAQGINPPLIEFLDLEPQKLNQMFRTTKRLAKSTVTLLT